MGNKEQEWRLCRITGVLLDRQKYTYRTINGEEKEYVQIRIDTTTDEDRKRGFNNNVVLNAYRKAITYAEKFEIGTIVDVWFNPVSRPTAGGWSNATTMLIATNIFPSVMAEDDGNRFDGFDE